MHVDFYLENEFFKGKRWGDDKIFFKQQINYACSHVIANMLSSSAL